MVKRQKEKQYQSAREHRANAALRSGSATAAAGVVPQRRLPFGHCALTLQPYTEAVCNPHNPGILYDPAALLPFLLKWKRDPCTGAPLTSSQLVRLQMERNQEGDWQCPILTKALSDHSKIVAIRQSSLSSSSTDSSISSSRQVAHVYSYTAYKKLNVQAKNYTDLLSGEPFDPATDVLILRDPDGPAPLAIEDFYYIRHADEFPKDDDDGSNSIRQTATASRILAQLDKKKKQQQEQQSQTNDAKPAAASSASQKDGAPVIMAQDVTGVQLTTAAGAASFTSTGMELSTANAMRPATADEILQAQCRMLRSLKEKGYVRLVTNKGALVVEIHCDVVPQTATNFLGLCAAGRYDGTSFHRLIPKFMIQGGKASSKKGEKGTEDASLWGGTFRDEFDARLVHDERGVVAMANAGSHTNKQQFYITFAPCTHLDHKHSVFGKVIQGMSVLDDMEKVGRDDKDRPLDKIVIERTEILANPVEKANEKEAKRIQKLQQARLKKEKEYSSNEPAKKKLKTSSPQKGGGGEEESTIGKYLKNRLSSNGGSSGKTSKSRGIGAVGLAAADSTKKKVKAASKKTTFGNFSGW